MYQMIEIDEIPETRRGRPGKHVDQLREFMDSGMKRVRLANDPNTARSDYNGLLMASARPEFQGRIAVKKNGTTLYLIRRG